MLYEVITEIVQQARQQFAGRGVVEVDDHLGRRLAQRLPVEGAQVAFAVVVVDTRQLRDAAGLAEMDAAEVLLVVDAFDPLGGGGGDLDPLVV